MEMSGLEDIANSFSTTDTTLHTVVRSEAANSPYYAQYQEIAEVFTQKLNNRDLQIESIVLGRMTIDHT